MNILASRLPALKFVAVAAALQFGLTLFSNSTGTPMVSISEYMEGNIQANTPFIITGVLKPRSVKMAKGLQKRFKITDNVYDINCLYNGMTKTQFREGELLVMQSYCPNIAKRENIIVKTYLTKHSMQSNEWQKKNSVDKQSYGLESSYS